MIEKVKVSREVADFLDSCANSGVMYWEDDLITQHATAWAEGFESVKENAVCMNVFTPMELAKILINGYEIEETPEEKLLAEYKTCYCSTDYEIGYRDGIEATLMHLGIKIKGIND